MSVTAVDADELTLDIISNVQDFEELASDWSSLAACASGSTVFMQWDWHYTWWQVFARSKDRLYIMVWRHQGRPVGLLPMYIRHSFLPADSALCFIGTGGPCEDEVATEYSDLLADKSIDQLVSRLACAQLQSFVGWQRVELSCLLGNALLLAALTHEPHKTLSIRSTGQRYRVSLDVDEDSWLSMQGPSRIKRIQRSRKALSQEGVLRVQLLTDISDLARAYQDLSELNHERQVSKRRKGVFTSKRFREFHRLLCARLIDKGAANIVRYHVGTRLIAILYCFYDDDTCHYYQSGFTRKDANRLMPLTLAHLSEMQRCREAGLRYYDFMRGEPPCYKDELACETTPMFNVSLYRTSFQCRVAGMYRRLRSHIAGQVRRLLKTIRQARVSPSRKVC